MNVNKITAYAFSKSKILKEVVTNPSNEYVQFHLERVSEKKSPLEFDLQSGINSIINANRDYVLNHEINMIMGGHPELNILI